MKKSDSEDALNSSKAEVSGELPETRKRLLDSAEELFARQGFDGTSIRDLVTRAGCKNISAVNYYFGDKKGLYEELFRERLQEMRESRLKAIEAVMDRKNKPTLEKLLGAYAEDFLKPFKDPQRSQRFMQLFFREMAERRLPENMFFNELAGPTLTAMEEALTAVCPELSGHDAMMIVISVTGQLVHIMQVRVLFEGVQHHSIGAIDIDEAINHIVKFSAAGIRNMEKGS
jgi:AcrR family transcriptional regulator